MMMTDKEVKRRIKELKKGKIMGRQQKEMKKRRSKAKCECGREIEPSMGLVYSNHNPKKILIDSEYDSTFRVWRVEVKLKKKRKKK